jgi:hypothetical protein
MPILNLPPELLLGNKAQVVNKKLGEGIQGNYDTVQIMREIAHARKGDPTVRMLAESIMLSQGVGSMDYAHEAKAIGEYVRQKMRYSRDPNGIEQVQDPLLMIDKITRGVAQGDCDDMALLIVTLLLSIGHDPYFRIVKYKPFQPFFSHIYVVDYEKDHGQADERIVLDAILKTYPIGTEVPHASGEEIQV